MQNLLIKKGVSLSILLLIAVLSALPVSLHNLLTHSINIGLHAAPLSLWASRRVQVLKTVHNNIIKERKDWMEKKNGERKAVHKIITLFCLCMHFGVDEHRKVFGGPKVTAK